MAATAAAINDDMVQTLRKANLLAKVTFGIDPSDTSVPRANLVHEAMEVFHPDDRADGRWIRLRTRVCIRARSDDASEGLGRATQLAEAAMAVLLADPYRGGLCQDLPIGRATEVDRLQVSDSVRRPDVEVSFLVRCHCEL